MSHGTSSARRCKPLVPRQTSARRFGQTRVGGLIKRGWPYGLAAFCLYYAWVSPAVTVPNERSRLFLAIAVIDEASFAIDGTLRRFGSIADLASARGRFFSDKAPGSSFVGALVYGALRCFSPSNAWSDHDLLLAMRRLLMIPIGLLGLWFLRRCLARRRLGEVAIHLTSLGWILGTPAFHYSTAYYGHVIVSTCLLGAFDLLEHYRDGSSRRTQLAMLAVGLFLGVAGLTEYQAIPAAGLMALFAATLPGPGRGQRLAFIGLPAVLCAGLLAYYHGRAFGGVLELPYHHLARQAVQQLHSSGLGGTSYPSLTTLGKVLFWPSRGLLATAPLLAVALLAWLAPLLSSPAVRLPWVAWAVPVYYIAFVSSSQVWYGGSWSYGPRLLVPVMGFLALAVGLAWDRIRYSWLRGAIRGLMLYGVVTQLALQVTFPEPPLGLRYPLSDMLWPALQAKALSPNLLQSLGVGRNLWSLLPLTAVLLVGGIYALGVPWSTAVCRSARRRDTFAACLGLLFCGGVVVALHGGQDAAAAVDFTHWLVSIGSEN